MMAEKVEGHVSVLFLEAVCDRIIYNARKKKTLIATFQMRNPRMKCPETVSN